MFRNSFVVSAFSTFSFQTEGLCFQTQSMNFGLQALVVGRNQVQFHLYSLLRSFMLSSHFFIPSASVVGYVT